MSQDSFLDGTIRNLSFNALASHEQDVDVNCMFSLNPATYPHSMAHAKTGTNMRDGGVYEYILEIEQYSQKREQTYADLVADSWSYVLLSPLEFVVRYEQR